MKYSLVCLLAGALGVTCLSFPVFADQQDFVGRLATCKDISSLVTRAQCYDTAIDDYDLGTLKKRQTGVEQNGWRIETKKSPMTDNTNVSLTLNSTALFTTRDNIQVHQFLVLACNEGRPNAYVSWNTEIGMPDGGINPNSNNIVNSRLGVDPVVAERWQISTDKTASFIPKPAEFYTKLLNAKGVYSITVWASAYYNTINATFDVQGLADKIKPLKDACGLP